ncbi:MAG: C13 family peptidase [Acidobacteria bacterium]|nr:C13 family peptidase [Acidobacteriota bacterium]
MRSSIMTFLLLTLLGVTACAQDVPIVARPQEKQKQEKPKIERPVAPRMPADKNKFAVIISGVSGEEGYAKTFSEWTSKLRSALTESLGFAEDQVIVLAEKPMEGELLAKADVVRQTFATLRSKTKVDSQIFIFFIGHGSFQDKIAKFMIIGADLSANDYAQLINNLPARNIVIVNMSSASGEFIKPLSGNGRIIITATRSGNEQNATRFAEYFVASLGNPEADADKNGRVSVLEAFNYASKLTNDSYQQAGKLVTEHSLIDDNGDGTGHQKAEAGDGLLARTTYFDSLPQQQAGGDPELAKLFTARMRLEGEVEQLKARKDQMKQDVYEAELEKLLIELAKINQSIKARQK